MSTACYPHLMIYSTSSNSKKNCEYEQVTTTQQWMSERQIFDSVNHRTLIHMPAASAASTNQKKQRQHYVKRRATATTTSEQNNLLNLQTKIPLNIGDLDNVLFVSTLEVVGCWSTRTTIKRPTTMEMKRQSSLSQHQQQQPICYPSRRYSQPENTTIQQQQQRYNQIIQQQQQQPYDHYNSSSSSSSNSSITSIAERRMSIQSDAALSTELIRRFSSGSTTSTVATSISASSSLLLVETTKSSSSSSDDIINQVDDAQTHQGNEEILINEPTIIIPPPPELTNDNNIPTNEQQLGHDPGHARDTMHSPYKLQQQQQQQQQHNKLNHNTQQQQNEAPVWADPIKVKENPTRYEYLLNYLQQNQISFSSELPLQKPCVFYFSDNNNKEESYMSTVKSVFQCDTVWQFSSRWRAYKEAYCKKPSQLLANQNLFCFIKGVEPMWEDEVNQKGGRLIVNIQQNNGKLLDDVFEWILCSFIGASLFDDGVVGIVVSRRNRGDRIELWLDQTNSSLPLFKEKLCGLLPPTCHNEINASRYKKHF